MAIDSPVSDRKHHRSQSDDESPEKSKRHKHRHHRHHRRRHRHHRSKHEEEERKDEMATEGVKSGDYDMEEGEIVEEGGVVGAIDDGEDKKVVVSDLESGELNDCDMGVVDGIENSSMNNDTKSVNILKSVSDRSSDSKNHRTHANLDESPESVSVADGGSRNVSSKGVSSRGRSKSPLKSSGKHKDKHKIRSKEKPDELMILDDEKRDGRRSSYHVETYDRRSESPDRLKEREHSESIVHDRRARSRHAHHGRDEGIYENGNAHDIVYEERDYRYDRGEKADLKRRERSSSRHRSSIHENGDSFDRKRDETGYMDRRFRDLEPVRSRTDRDWDNERDRRGRYREREWESDRDKDKVREAKRVVDSDREHRKEEDRGRSRVTDHGGDSNLDRERDRKRIARDSYRGRVKYDDESDRSRKYHKYEDRANGHGGRDSRHDYEESEYMEEGNRKSMSWKHKASKKDPIEDAEDAKRDDDDQNGYLERVELKLAEQEEDDVEKIKEESRRLREAILQKYKAKQSQQAVPQDTKAESNARKEQSTVKVASANAVQETLRVGGFSSVAKSPLKNGTPAEQSSTGDPGLGKGSPKSEVNEQSNDMFCDDMFGDSPAGIRKTGKGDGLPTERSGLHDNWDDPEGYYSFRFGEILDGRYEVTAAHGKGVFSTVVRAKDLKVGSGEPEEVAIKIIRNNETMLKAGTEELVILKKLVGADPEDRRHCVRYLSHFKYRNHLCIVFESLHMNLREVLKKFGRNIGLKLTAVRTYAMQLFIALKHLRNCGVLHSDIKPDNMLVNEAKNVLKLCDFGNAMLAGKNEITPYLVSRFYRAPEIILGLPYDHPMDIWSVGCCLYELYTGKVLFPGATNNDMLRLHMELKGPFSKKMLRKGAFVEAHFDQDLNFLATEEDPVTRKAMRKLLLNIKPKDIGTIITGSAGEDPKMLANFKDLLDKIFALDPDKRLTVSQALNHPFITGK